MKTIIQPEFCSSRRTATDSSCPPEPHMRPSGKSRGQGVSKDVPAYSMNATASKQGKHTVHGGSGASHTPVQAFDIQLVSPERLLLPTAAVTSGYFNPGVTVDMGFQPHGRLLSHVMHSSGSVSSRSNAKPAGEVAPFPQISAPWLPFTSRCHDDYTSIPECLDLDRCGLVVCPHLEGGEKVRQLSLQYNFITRIQNLSHFQHLLFLDMYRNHISDMSGISTLCCLQVLLLGKNRIKKVSGLENLTKLDTLDLHGNQISQIEKLSHLSGLRILNLAGNSVSRVDNLQGLNSLIELNLCQNCVSSVTEVDQLPSLQRLFLSCNSISSFDQLSCLGKSVSLLELTLDGNPVARDACYKHTVLRCVLHLRQLDAKRVTEEERRLAYALARKAEEKKKESHKQALQKEKRRLAICNAAQQWESFRVYTDHKDHSGTGDMSPEEDIPTSLGSLLPQHCHNNLRYTEKGSANAQNLCLSNNHLAELDGGTLHLFGPGALEVLERGWSTLVPLAVTAISFRYIHFNIIVPTLPSIRVKFPNLMHLIFLETDISCLSQLSALAQLRCLNQLTIHSEGNPVVGMVLWRPYLIYRLHHLNLQKVNDLEVTMDEVVSAKKTFGSLGHVAAKETPNCRLLLLLAQPRKHQLNFLLEGRAQRAELSPQELRNSSKLLGESMGRALLTYPSWDARHESTDGTVEAAEKTAVAQQFLYELVQETSHVILKGETLRKLWPLLFVDMVRDCVLDMKDRRTYGQSRLSRLSVN